MNVNPSSSFLLAKKKYLSLKTYLSSRKAGNDIYLIITLLSERTCLFPDTFVILLPTGERMGLKIGLSYHFGCHQASPQNDTLSLRQPPIKWFSSGQPETITWGNPLILLYRWPKKLWGFLELRKFKNRYLAL